MTADHHASTAALHNATAGGGATATKSESLLQIIVSLPVEKSNISHARGCHANAADSTIASHSITGGHAANAVTLGSASSDGTLSAKDSNHRHRQLQAVSNTASATTAIKAAAIKASAVSAASVTHKQKEMQAQQQKGQQQLQKQGATNAGAAASGASHGLPELLAKLGLDPSISASAAASANAPIARYIIGDRGQGTGGCQG